VLGFFNTADHFDDHLAELESFRQRVRLSDAERLEGFAEAAPPAPRPEPIPPPVAPETPSPTAPETEPAPMRIPETQTPPPAADAARPADPVPGEVRSP
jgi:hypothetical protein